MKHFHLLAPPLAATAVVGIALMGLAGTAGASTVSVSVPGVLGGVAGNPVVNIGSGSVPPVPGTTATVPVHGHDDVQVDNPNIVPTGSSDPAGLLGSTSGHLVTEHSSIDACVAAALLTDRSPNGCGPMASGVSSLADSISNVGSEPSLVDSLSNVGACVRLAVADAAPIDSCSTPSIMSITPGSPATTVPALDGQMNGVLADNGLCPIGQQLGLADLATCEAHASTNGTSATDASGNATALNGAATANVCRGLAAITGVDESRCSTSGNGSASGAPNGTTGNGTNLTAGQNATVGATTPSAPLNAACAPRDSSVGGTAPSTTAVAGGFAGLGFVLAGVGSRIRRMRRPVVA
jgi:hypothetical protein